ncbi:pre-rRNA 2'-O-ribose RNA methyltransferase FTSJ3 [Onychostruthus taczanowskii]|uniref:pre-rRNA 2'-O-ribose RNA methyltransferase FTSJ3 n=1 Tax=Onychostruthus taczanowskii TaxID=356909 RepID=UPI001B8090B8|nr:pre-rRNA 2'-O-ribose RNA methyltransferase FTSJ3 [Onychostruthus taczanowskii]XP_041254984.1 pre-rRNA 2'-O-ribose RNA methyltransferase FTSJ3 [Onychostruthus taczanowskii]XP_041254985.1 pre-rRNA 2'-O-ribose RNA methyltransferase FTSJ3 [Onychostruthus taczanowskii]XP_041254986.1 pre-rRNA 2'-O-ribose RNA methyltransferase FTSJ3 [Onychostruthus taczanowskii]XP_041254987.1 pre-rRNA 2'-O-ribose RNA methyltransferase FTSJ3 [Onychostruthus taczanowskii]
MGKKSKLGKSRRDKFYHLAKETGFRSRSSFKLLQLNRKFQFLQKARALLDLCAAPGGWLQVASKFMPVSSLIIGVDLVPIKPIPNVVTLQEDITTEKCRQALRKELQTWKVDVVLNDGAPNVGASWVHDAYSQANLTLMALKLACEFLCKGGWFITKVFRSRDYQPLLWIFQQFFQKVQATKPQASRNESAEIFVVCQGYQAPDKIDSKFFDPKYAFKDVEVTAKSVSELVSKKKPKAEGYAEGDTTLYHRFTLMDFLKAPNPVDFLSKANEITLGNGELENHSSTTEELRQCCKDIRVLGRKELRALLNWRTKLRRFLAKKLKEQAKELDINLSSGEEEEGREEEKKEKMEAKAAAAEEAKEQEEVELALAEMKAKELAELKRKKKKILKEQRKQRERVELKMDLPGVSIADDGDTSMFSLKSIHRTPLLDELSRGDMASADALLESSPGDDDIYVSDHDEEDDVSLASDLDPEELLEIEARQRKLQREQPGKRAKFKQKKEEEEEQEVENPLLVPLEEKSVLEERQTSLWFGKDAFAGIEDDADEELELGQAQMLAERQREAQRDKTTKKEQKKKKKKVAQEEAPAEPSPAAATDPDASEAQEEQSSDDDSSSEDERPLAPVGRKRGRVEPCGFEVVPIEKPVKRVLDAEGLALGSVIATSKKARRDLIDDSFNRYSYNEEEGELPEWFTEEERQHRRRQLPVDKQTVEAYRQRWKEINARPIKKVAEAKARKKKRMLKKLEQMKKKAEAVVSTVDISEREKVAQLRRIYKKAGLAKEKRQVTYLVAKKGVGRRVRRPPGVKGQFKVVDSRLKKDVRAQKRKEQKKKRHK